MTQATLCCTTPGCYCARVDALFNVAGVHVLEVGWDEDRPTLTVETDPSLADCPSCGVLAVGHGRRDRVLHDIPAFGSPVRLTCSKRTYRCVESACPAGVVNDG